MADAAAEEIQKASAEGRKQWSLWCETHGHSVRDPTKHSPEFLREFLEYWKDGGRLEASMPASAGLASAARRGGSTASDGVAGCPNLSFGDRGKDATAAWSVRLSSTRTSHVLFRMGSSLSSFHGRTGIRAKLAPHETSARPEGLGRISVLLDEMTRASALLSGARRAPPPEVRVTRLEEKGAWAVEMRPLGPAVVVLFTVDGTLPRSGQKGTQRAPQDAPVLLADGGQLFAAAATPGLHLSDVVTVKPQAGASEPPRAKRKASRGNFRTDLLLDDSD
ncbi:unnamed protein product [Effrenium voratum]|nr:unnamed protein product [Effrenium voratum]